MAESFKCAYDELVELHKLQPNPKNSNNHPEKQIELLAKIIDYQGQRSPIVVSNRSGFITKGHGRLLALQKLGWSKAAVDFQDYENEAQEFADLIADNKIAELAEHDDHKMFDEILKIPDLNLEMLGIPDLKLPEIFEPQADEDGVPDNVEPRTKLGDVYSLGRHRLMCGDSTSIDAVEKLMNGAKADITFTSPPYNLGDNASLRGSNGSGEKSAYRTKSDHKSSDEYLSFLNMFTLNALNFSEIVFCNIQILAGNKLVIPQYWYGLKEKLVDILIWDKVHAQPSAAEHVLNSVWEFIFAFTNDENTSRSIDTGKRFRGTIDNIYRLNPVGKKDELAKDHRAVFPVQFAEHFVDNFSKESVLDLFGGSGSTLIACEKTNRKCFMMELDPYYCDVIVARWEKYTGKKAELLMKNG